MNQSVYFLDLWAELQDGSRVYPYKGIRGKKKGLFSVNFTNDNKDFEGISESELRELVESGKFSSRGVVRMLPLNAASGSARNAFAPTHYRGAPLVSTALISKPNSPSVKPPIPFAMDLNPDNSYTEGVSTKILVNSYERNAAARRACLDYHGYACKACDLDFGDRYGDIGRGFIHVHHVVKISSIGKEYKINPITDLIPVCPNCHAMIHQFDPPLSVESLRKHIREV